MHWIFSFSILCMSLVSCNKPQVPDIGEAGALKSSHRQVHALSDNNCEMLAAGLLDKEVKLTESNDQDAIGVEFKIQSSKGNIKNQTLDCYFEETQAKISNPTSDF